MPQQTSHVSDTISRKLSALESHVRRLKLLRGAGIFAIVVAAAVATGFLVDILRENSVTTRLGILGSVIATCVVGFYLCIVRPLFRRYTSEELAAVVETAHPHLRESLTSHIELNDPDVPEEHKGSAFMRSKLGKQADKSAAGINFKSAVSKKRSLRTSLVGFGAFLVLLSPFILTPSGYGLLWARFFTPWQNLESAGNLYFDVEHSGEVVAKGKDVTIVAEPKFRYRNSAIPKTAWLNWKNESGKTDSLQMNYNSDTQKFSATLPHVFESFAFKVTSGRAMTREYGIKVVEAPAIVAARLDAESPAYTSMPKRGFDGASGELPVFENSELSLTVKFNKPVEKVEFIWLNIDTPIAAVNQADAKNKNAAKKVVVLPIPKPDCKFTLSADKTSATMLGKATLGGQFSIRVTDEHGLTNEDLIDRRLLVTRDLPPELSLEGNRVTQKVRPSDIVPVNVTATDDIGIGAIELHYEIKDGAKDVLRAEPARLGGKQIAYTFRLDLSAIKVANGQSISYRIRAADERPVPAPNEVWSDPRTFFIDQNAKPAGATDLADRQKQIKDTLTTIRKAVEKNRKDVDAIQQEADEDLRKQLKFNKDKEVDLLARQQEQLGQKLEQLADQFSQNPLYANLVKKTQDVARDGLNKSGKQLTETKNIPLKGKPKALKENVDQLAVSEQKLRDLEKEFEKLAAIEQDLLELNQLAENAAKIADEAQRLDDKLKNAPKDETPQEKQAREQNIANQQNQLMEHQEDLANRLDDLLKRRPELLDAARKQELDKLAELAKKALELAKPQDALAEALKKEAEADANDVEALTKKQEELLKEAEEIAAKAELQGGKTAVKPIDPDKLRKAIEDLKAGNLKAATERQEDAAKDLNRLAAELKKNDALSSDPQKAVEQLAKRQDELQKKLAEQNKQAPAKDATPEQKAAFKKQLRPLAAEQAGIQVGIAKLKVPQKNQAEKQETLKKSAEAVQDLIASEPKKSEESTKNTTEALRKLAKNIGSEEERKIAAQKQLEELRKQQQAVAKQVAQETAKQKPGQKPTKQSADQLRKLAKQQEAIARKVADLDAPKAEDAKQQALQKSVAAMTDLEKRRIQDAEASQAKAEQAIAKLQKKLAGKPTADEEVKQLVKQQADLKKQSDETLKKSPTPKLNPADKKQLQAKAAEQKTIAKKLAQLDTPATRSEQKAAQKAAENAAEKLEKGEDRKQVADALKKADDKLNQLQKAVAAQSKPKSPAEQAQELTKKQQAAAKAAEKTAQAQKSPTPKEQEQAGEQLRKIARDTKRLPAGDAAQAEKKEALEQLKKAEKKQQQLEQLAKKEQPQNAAALKKPSDELKRLVKENAQAQKQAADALQKLAKKIDNKAAQKQAAQEQKQNQEKQETLNKPNQPNPEQLAKQAEQLAKEQAAIRKQTEQAAGEKNANKQAAAMNKVAQDQQKLQQKAQQLPANQAPLPRAEALQKLQAVKDALKQAKPQQAIANQKKAEQALQNLAKRAQALAKNQPAKPQQAQANNTPKPNANPMGNPKTQQNQNAQKQNAQKLAQAAQELAKKQSDLAKQVAQLQNKKQNSQQAAAKTNPGQQAKTNPMTQQANNNIPPKGQPNGQKTQPKSPTQQAANQNAAQKAMAQQRQIAQEAAKLAVQTAKQQGPMSPAAKQAADFARKANAASKQANTGQLKKAGESAQQASKAAQQASKQLAKNTQQSAKPLQKQSNQLAQRQVEAAKQLQQLSQSTANRRNAQQAGQKQLAKQTSELTKQFEKTAQKLASQPLNQTKPGQQAKQSGESTQKAQQAMKKAAQQASKGNPGQASQAAKQAAESLKQAANQAQQAAKAQQPAQSPIPGKIAEKVADAAMQLAQAQKQLAQAQKAQQQAAVQQPMGQSKAGQQANGKPMGQPMGQPKGQPMGQPKAGQQANGKPMGQPGQKPGQPGQPGKPGQGQPGQGQPGQGQPKSSLAKSAQSLKQVAQSLAQAAQQLQPGQQGQPGQPTPGQQGQPGQPGQQQAEKGQPGKPGEGGDGKGAQAKLDLRAMEAQLKKLSKNSQAWGRLPGHLRTEIIQGAKANPNSHYAKLIKLYFKDIAKKERIRNR